MDDVIGRLDKVFVAVCRVSGEMAGAIVRRRMRRGTLHDWAMRLRLAAEMLDEME